MPNIALDNSERKSDAGNLSLLRKKTFSNNSKPAIQYALCRLHRFLAKDCPCSSDLFCSVYFFAKQRNAVAEQGGSEKTLWISRSNGLIFLHILFTRKHVFWRMVFRNFVLFSFAFTHCMLLLCC